MPASTARSGPEEWPHWLGPRGNGISSEHIAESWPPGGPKKVWEQKVGLGYSSPIGFGGSVYLFTQQGRTDTLTAFDAETGSVVWSQSYTCTTPADSPQAANPENGLPLPAATPAIDSNRIYTYGGGGDLTCRDLNGGTEIWRVNVLKQLNAKILTWNQASSPLVDGDLVYLQGGKGGPAAVAVDKNSGAIVWVSEARTDAGYAAPVLIEVQGARQLIIFGGTVLYGMDPRSGKTIWQQPWETNYGVNAATPVYFRNHLFVSSDYNTGSLMLSVSAAGAHRDWASWDVRVKFQPVILDRGFLYLNSAGLLKCLRWPDGKAMWEIPRHQLNLQWGGSLVRTGDKLITLSERGKLGLVRAMPSGYTILAQVPLFDSDDTYSIPLIYRGRLYAAGKGKLVCLEMSRQ